MLLHQKAAAIVSLSLFLPLLLAHLATNVFYNRYVNRTYAGGWPGQAQHGGGPAADVADLTYMAVLLACRHLLVPGVGSAVPDPFRDPSRVRWRAHLLGPAGAGLRAGLGSAGTG